MIFPNFRLTLLLVSVIFPASLEPAITTVVKICLIRLLLLLGPNLDKKHEPIKFHDDDEEEEEVPPNDIPQFSINSNPSKCYIFCFT